MFIDLFIYSLKNLKKRKLRTWLTIIGIIIGIASVIALISLGNGLREAILSQFGSISADVLSVRAGGIRNAGPPGTGVVNPLKKDYVDDIKSISYVETAFGRLIRSVKIEFNDIQTVGFIGSYPDGEARKYADSIFNIKTQQGRLLKDGDKNKVVLGYNFIKDTNDFKKPIRVGDKILLNNVPVEVIGISQRKGSFIFDNVIWINEESARSLLNIKDDLDIIAVKVKDINEIDKAKEAIEKYLRKKRNVRIGEEDFNVQTAQSLIKSVNDILGGIQIFVVIIASISMVVGAVGIINTMFTAVLERRKEIGIMKAIGAKNFDIFYIFFIESGLIGLIGGILGIIIGFGIAFAGLSLLSSILGINATLDFDIKLISLSLVGSFFIGSVSGIIPALQAAKMQPVDALRS